MKYNKMLGFGLDKMNIGIDLSGYVKFSNSNHMGTRGQA